MILSLLEDATWLKLNEDELTTLFPAHKDLESCCKSVVERFNLEALFVTRGGRGAVAWTRDRQSYPVAPGQALEVVDTVGAGDGFSSVLLMGLVNNWPPEVIMERAQDFASGIVTIQGATTMNRDFYDSFKTKWALL